MTFIFVPRMGNLEKITYLQVLESKNNPVSANEPPKFGVLREDGPEMGAPRQGALIPHCVLSPINIEVFQNNLLTSLFSSGFPVTSFWSEKLLSVSRIFSQELSSSSSDEIL